MAQERHVAFRKKYHSHEIPNDGCYGRPMAELLLCGIPTSTVPGGTMADMLLLTQKKGHVNKLPKD